MENTVTNGRRMSTKKMTALAMFTALSYLCVFVFRFKVQFLSFEMSDIFITICGFAFGPLAALGVSFAKALIEMVTIADTGIYGAVMNFVSSAAFACTASAIYKYKKSLSGAVVSMTAAIAARTVVIIGFNILVTPFYMHCPTKVVLAMIPTLLLPFNLIKAVMNAGLVFMLYKPLTAALRSAGLMPSANKDFDINKKSAAVMIISALAVVGSAIALIFCLNGSFQWVK